MLQGKRAVTENPPEHPASHRRRNLRSWPAMEYELSGGLSTAAIIAIACNSVVAVLILILLVILYRACKVPSTLQKAPVLTVLPIGPEQQKKSEQKYLLSVP